MAEEGALDRLAQAAPSALGPAESTVTSSVVDYGQGFMDPSMLNGPGLTDQTTLSGLLPNTQDPALLNYYYTSSAMPNVAYGVEPWSSGATQVAPLDPNFLSNAGSLPGLGADQQFLANDALLNMPAYSQLQPYYMPATGDNATNQQYPWTDPVMTSLFNPVDATTYAQAPFTTTIDGHAAGTEGLPPVDVAGTMPLAHTYLGSNFAGSGMEPMSDLEHTFANLGSGMIGAPSVPGQGLPVTDASSGASLPVLVNMHSVMTAGIAEPVPSHRSQSSTTEVVSSNAASSTASAPGPIASSKSPRTAPHQHQQPQQRSQPAKVQTTASSGPPKPMSWASVAGSAPKRAVSPPVQARQSTSPSAVQHQQQRQVYAPQQHHQQQHHQQQHHQQQHHQQHHQQQSVQVFQSGGSGRPQSNHLGNSGSAWPRPSSSPSQTVGNGSPAASAAAAAGTSTSRAPRHRPKPGVGGDIVGLDSIDPAESGKEGLEKLRAAHEYNPKDPSVVKLSNARFFVIKSYSEDDIHRSIKYSVWTSTEHGNKRLDSAYREQKGKPVYLFFSVNGSGHFCGCARMCSEVDYTAVTGIWSQDKWKGKFEVQWIYVKDVPNGQLRHIRLENNENKPVTNSRDTQEIPPDKARQVMKIVHSYRHTTSIFDDFGHYEKRQEEGSKRSGTAPTSRKGASH